MGTTQPQKCSFSVPPKTLKRKEIVFRRPFSDKKYASIEMESKDISICV
jgi:hypothetical protein